LAVSASGAGECSGFRGLLLPGLGNSPPYILALLPLPAGTGSAAPSAEGAEESSGSGSSGDWGATAQYELRATANPQPTTFMMLPAD
jgi:hypothetical protein